MNKREYRHEETAGEAIVLSMGMEASGKWVLVHGEIKRGEVRKAIGNLSVVKAAGINGMSSLVTI